MGKRTISPDPTFSALQNKWYEILKDHDFKDIEDTTREDRPLKKWTGISIELKIIAEENRAASLLDFYSQQHTSINLTSSFPEPIFKREEAFVYHKEFKAICKSLCSHGHCKLSAIKIEHIWRDYTLGISCRKIAKKYKIDHTRIYRTLLKLNEWMNFLSTGDSMEQETKVVIRPYITDDAAFVYSTWRNSLWYDKKRDSCGSDSFYRTATKKIKHLIKMPGVEIKIACLSDDHNHILGCSVKTNNCLEWVYVKEDYRNEGIAKLLCYPFKEITKPSTKIGAAIAKNKGLKIKGEKDVEEKNRYTGDAIEPKPAS